jgi:hypothetical protein
VEESDNDELLDAGESENEEEDSLHFIHLFVLSEVSEIDGGGESR